MSASPNSRLPPRISGHSSTFTVDVSNWTLGAIDLSEAYIVRRALHPRRCATRRIRREWKCLNVDCQPYSTQQGCGWILSLAPFGTTIDVPTKAKACHRTASSLPQASKPVFVLFRLEWSGQSEAKTITFNLLFNLGLRPTIAHKDHHRLGNTGENPRRNTPVRSKHLDIHDHLA